MADVSNRFLSIEIIIPFLILGAGGIASFASLSADVDHKAEKIDIAVISTELKHIAEDVSDNSDAIKNNNKIAKKNHDMLVQISADMGLIKANGVGDNHDHEDDE